MLDIPQSHPIYAMPNPTDPMTLTLEAIATLRPGPELDRYVHTLVLGLPDEPNHEPPPYSETPASLSVLDVVPIEIGRLAQNDSEYTEHRPYFGRFQVGPVQDPKRYMFRCPSAEVALCKTALAYITVTKKQ